MTLEGKLDQSIEAWVNERGVLLKHLIEAYAGSFDAGQVRASVDRLFAAGKIQVQIGLVSAGDRAIAQVRLSGV